VTRGRPLKDVGGRHRLELSAQRHRLLPPAGSGRDRGDALSRFAGIVTSPNQMFVP